MSEEDFTEAFSNSAKKTLSSEESDSMTSREKVDTILEDGGSEVLEKMGVPKSLGKKAIEKDGGTFMPTNGPTQKAAKNYSRNKLAEGLDKIDAAKNELDSKGGYERANSGRNAYERQLGNKNFYNDKKNDIQNQRDQLNKDREANQKKRDSSSERLQKAKENHANQRGYSNRRESRDELREAKKDYKEAKREEKELNKKENSLKNDEKNLKKDSRKAKAFKAMHPVEAAKMAISKPLNMLKKKVILIIGSICIGLFLIFFVIEMILGALEEVWGYIDSGITGVADFSEKVTNFYNGFGFQNTKEAFYDEIDYWYDEYDGELDVPLILATLFYTECMYGYDTNYGETSIINSDNGDIDGMNASNMWGTIKSYVYDKFIESYETVGDDGLNYTTGKIVRLRKLARHQFETGLFGLDAIPTGTTPYSLSDFIDRVADRLGADLLSLLKQIPSTFNIFNIKDIIYDIVKIVEGEENLSSIVDSEDGLLAALKRVLKEIFYTVGDITNIDIGGTDKDGEYHLIIINVATYKYNEDEYKQYLQEYYLEKMPEFQSILPASGDEREKVKGQIIDQIYENKDLFEDIFLENVSTSSESYTNNCVGGIPKDLVTELQYPVDIADNQTISFSENYSYGIRDGKKHDGVDLNEETASVRLGSNVYAVDNGKIESIDDIAVCDGNDVCNKTIKISHTRVIDNKEYNYITVYTNVVVNDGITVKKNVSKGDAIATIATDNNAEGLHFSFLDTSTTSSGVSVDPTNLFIKCSSSVELTGDTNEEKIWNWLLQQGYTKIAAAGVMGNWSQESGFASNNLENGANSKSNLSDEQFTSDVDNNKISKEDFKSSSRFGIPPQPGTSYDGLKYGYGLAQWTDPGRKGNLYDYWKSYDSSVSIGDLGMQLGFYSSEVASNYSDLIDKLNASTSPSNAAQIFVNSYEGGTAASARRQKAEEIYKRYAGNTTN